MAGRCVCVRPDFGRKIVAGLFFVLCFAAAVTVPPAAPAEAQGHYYRGPFFLPFNPYYEPRRRRPTPRHRAYRAPHPREKPATTAAWFPKGDSKDPVQLIISLPDQRIAVYQGDKELVSSKISSGRDGYLTPTGVFTILEKKVFHRSNIYSRAPMPFMQRLTWSGIALHASNSVPNQPASHGCIRLPPPFARELYTFTDKGGHVIIAKRDTAPYEVAHQALFQPRPQDRQDFDQQEIDRQLRLAGVEQEETKKLSTSPVRILVTRRTGRERLIDVQRLLNDLGFRAGKEDGWMGPDTASAIMRFQKANDLTADGLLSDPLIDAIYRAAGRGKPRNGHIYVRQDFRQLFDAPITIEHPDQPLGAHLLTAMHFEPGARRTRWLAVSLLDGDVEPRREAAAHKPNTTTDEIPMPAPTPALVSLDNTLDRIDIPEDIRARIVAILTPGSSLAISDSGLSKETFPKGTDFVVLTD